MTDSDRGHLAQIGELRPPSTTPISSPGPNDSPEIDLLTRPFSTATGCYQALTSGRLVRDPSSGLGIVLAAGDAYSVEWPFGYTARQEPAGAALIDPDGQVVTREGQPVAFSGGGSGLDGMFHACGRVYGSELDDSGVGP